MASLQYYMFAVLFVVFLCIQTGTSISCYECKSAEDAACASESLEKFKVDCSSKKTASNYTLCRKIQQWVDFDVNGLPAHDRIIRTCGWETSHYDTRCYYKAGFGGRQDVCTCKNDLCNKSPNTNAFALLVFTASALAIFRIIF